MKSVRIVASYTEYIQNRLRSFDVTLLYKHESKLSMRFTELTVRPNG